MKAVVLGTIGGAAVMSGLLADLGHWGSVCTTGAGLLLIIAAAWEACWA